MKQAFDIMPEEASKGLLEKLVIKFRTIWKQPVYSLLTELNPDVARII